MLLKLAQKVYRKQFDCFLGAFWRFLIRDQIARTFKSDFPNAA